MKYVISLFVAGLLSFQLLHNTVFAAGVLTEPGRAPGFPLSSSQILRSTHRQVALADSIVWKRAGGPYGGTITTLAASRDGKLFAGTQSGGVYFSTDDGMSWTPTGLADGSVRALAADSSGRLFASTYFALYRSTDDGVTWSAVDSTLAYKLVQSFLVDKQDNIFAGTLSGGLYESTDHGTSWFQTSLTNFGVYSLAVDSAGEIFAGGNGGIYALTDGGASWSQILQKYITVKSLAFGPGGTIFAGTYGSGVYVSSDSDSTWTQMNPGPGNSYVNSLAVDSSGRVFAGTMLGQFVSTDDGQNWVRSGSALEQENVGAIIVSPAGHIFSGASSGIFRSTDSGTSWARVDSGLCASEITSVAVAPSGDVFAASASSGLFRSTDIGKSWAGVGPLYAMNNYLNSVLVTPSGVVYAGAYGRGFYVSTDGGTTWASVSLPAPTSDIVYSLAVAPSGEVFAGSDLGGVYKSTDNGSSWYQMGVTGNDIGCLAIDSSGLIYAGAGGGSVWLSTDDGASWSLKAGFGVLYQVNSLTADFAGDIYAATDSGVYVSRDHGTNWEQCGLTTKMIKSVYVNSSGYIFAGTWMNGAYRSTDGGKSWAEYNGGLVTGMVNAFASNFSGQLFAGTNGGGVYYTSRTASPHPIPSPIGPDGVDHQPRLTTLLWHHTPDALVFHLQLASASDLDSSGAFVKANIVVDTSLADTVIKLSVPLAAGGKYYWHVAGTDTAGVSPYSATVEFATGTGLDAVNEQTAVPLKFALSQNYPNPFNPTTSIDYSIAVPGFVTLKVYDILGQEVSSLVDGVRQPGRYSVKFDGSRLASGVYFYRLISNGNSSTRKFVLVK